jgi:GH15 family glucan-1,4-alpha-glucosidase
MEPRTDGYAPIESYAAIGDARSVALVSSDGRIDWWPVEAMDATPTFAALLDPEAGGHIDLAPVDDFTSTRRYLPDTNVLETTFTTGTGSVRVLDALPLGVTGRLAWSELVRRVEGVDGDVAMQWAVEPGTQFRTAQPWVDRHRDAAVVHVGDEHLAVRACDIGELKVDGHRVTGRFTATAGSDGLLAVLGGVNAPVFFAERDEINAHLDLTIDRWREWSKSIAYDGRWADAVRRSALTLRQLMYAPTGAIIAAPTTSLPEQLGGPKNWDYRFMWVRDCSFTIDALLTLKLHNEVQSAVQWMLGALRSTSPDLQVFYTLDGGAPEVERRVDLPGYRGSQPVRAGNDAARQVQLGNFGDLFDTIWQYVDAGHCLDPASSSLLTELADRCCDVWQIEDSGIWELQQKRHYTVSKLGCWTALDRALRLAGEGQITTGHADRWERERDRVKAWIDENCWSSKKNSYTFYAGTDELDAAMLLAARTGFESGDRLAGTIDAICEELVDGAAVYRYSGAQQEEGAFIACSFWLVHALVVAGRLNEAADFMDRALAMSNDVGLFAEQIDPGSGAMLGNFPQGLSHLTLINAACAYQAATG